jgi:hypothetical protein
MCIFVAGQLVKRLILLYLFRSFREHCQCLKIKLPPLALALALASPPPPCWVRPGEYDGGTPCKLQTFSTLMMVNPTKGHLVYLVRLEGLIWCNQKTWNEFTRLIFF